jgi:hypothetical protein
MAINAPGQTFVSKGFKYVLDYGPKGNLRPYTVGPIKTAAKTRNPYIIGSAILTVAVLVVGIGTWHYIRKKKTQPQLEKKN